MEKTLGSERLLKTIKQVYASAEKAIEKNSFNGHVNWIPILKCEAINEFIGITEDGYWCLNGKSDLLILDKPHSFFHIITLTEQPLKAIQNGLINKFKSLNLEVDINEIFPFVEIIKEGLAGSEYWAELAFCWFQDLNSNQKMIVKESMIEAIQKKTLSQKSRNKAIIELKSLGFMKEQIFGK